MNHLLKLRHRRKALENSFLQNGDNKIHNQHMMITNIHVFQQNSGFVRKDF